MKNDNGFTLIELLVVVSIVGLLASIAIPQFAEYRNKAYRAEVQTYTHNIHTAANITFYDAGDKPIWNNFNPNRSAVMTLPGMPEIPDHIGTYVNITDHHDGSSYWEFFSLQVCHTKAIKDGRALTYRYKQHRLDYTPQTTIQNFLTGSDAMTQAECNTRSS